MTKRQSRWEMVPSEENVAIANRRIGWSIPVFRLAMWPWTTLRVEGAENLPAEGPALVLANHSNMFDPVAITIAGGRAMHWMGTSTLMNQRGVGDYLHAIGCIPRARFASDRRSILLSRKWAKAGGVVAVFPEGERTWTGRLAPILPGTGLFAHRLGVPVVLVRVENGYRQWPRWTPGPRRSPLVIRFLPPRTWPDGTPSAQIEADIAAALDVDPSAHPDLPVRGSGLARGLSNLVFRCPACGGPDALDEGADQLGCRVCGARWTVDDHHRLVRNGEALSLPALLDTLQEALSAEWSGGLSGPALVSDPLEVVEHGPERRTLARGPLQLWPDRLAVDGSDGWSVPLEEIRQVNVEFHRMLELRTRDGRFLKMEIPTGSAWIWPWAVRWWSAR